MKKISILLALLLVGCTDAQISNISALGKPHKVSMYNGGKLVREWVSTGKVETLIDSDGWQFKDQATGKLVRVGGDVIIEVV
jgi:hypothetical protein